MVYLPHWPIPSTLGKQQVYYETVFDRMSAVLAKLHNPHKKLPPVIQVAGTNGKGSCVALLSQIFRLAGYKTHTYTSPHLHDCNERILLNSGKISDQFLFEVMEETRIAAKDMSLTFMEGFTIGAFLAFAEVPADILILECGMGGRIDATNIVPNKIATVIMPISFDHMEYLGSSIEKIAFEKAMISRAGVPLICGPQSQEAKNIIKIMADDQRITSYFYDEDFAIRIDEENGEFDFQIENIVIENIPKPNLPGQHQYINSSVAIATVMAIRDKFTIDDDHIKNAIATVKWPSRLEKITNNLTKLLPTKNSEIYIDGAHNEAGAFALAKWFEEQNDEKENFIICGFSKGKCKKSFLDKIKNIAEIFSIRVDGEPYPEEAEVISKIGLEIDINIKPCDDILDAINEIKNKTKSDCRIVICGSLHLTRDVRKFSKMI